MKTHRTTLFAGALIVAIASGTFARAENEKTSLALPTLTVTFMPVYVAKDLGFWEKLGLDVSLHAITGMGATNAMLSGSVDFTVQSGKASSAATCAARRWWASRRWRRASPSRSS